MNSPRLSLTSSSLMPRKSWPSAGITVSAWLPMANAGELPMRPISAPAKFCGSGELSARRWRSEPVLAL